jgi:ABC-type bacteriocin/lantibiotic exporter with double-glycine peptidase domain
MELLSNNAVRPDRAVIVVTHDTRVFGYADQIAQMDDGRIVKTESRRRISGPSIEGHQNSFRGPKLTDQPDVVTAA